MVVLVRAMRLEGQENFFSAGQNPGGPVYLRSSRLFLTLGSLFDQRILSGDALAFLNWISGAHRPFYWKMAIPILFSHWDWSKSYFLRKRMGMRPIGAFERAGGQFFFIR